jgi:two-component system chemotaxis response regulator CheY
MPQAEARFSRLEDAAPTRSTVPPASRIPTARPPLRVLIAEDDRASREALSKAVKLLGHECRTAKDGIEAWQMHQEEPADVILSDWRMPRLDGLELCKRIRASERDGNYTYFIFMTGFDDREHLLAGMEAGADDYHGKPIDIDELQARLTSAARVHALHRRLARTNEALRRDSQASFRVARIDPLTEIANRLRMNEDLEALWPRAKRLGARYCAALCDIDWFKAYNDRFGHVAGDDVLRKIAQAIKTELREGDGLYRYGGEEFLVVLPGQSLADAVHAMNRVRLAVERLGIPTTGDKGVVTMSVGIAELSQADIAVESWLRRADEALYNAKASGRNRVEIV